MTIAAERNNKERFASIVEGLENHEAQQLQVGNHKKKQLSNVDHAYDIPFQKTLHLERGNIHASWPILLSRSTIICTQISSFLPLFTPPPKNDIPI